MGVNIKVVWLALAFILSGAATAQETLGSDLSKNSAPLEANFEIPKGARLGANRALPITITFRNPGNVPIRIHFLKDAESFRLFQSVFSLMSLDRRKVFFSWPAPHPHGYLIGPQDFHLLDPGQSVKFTQTIYLQDSPGRVPPEISGGGDFLLEWIYQNAAREWKSGVPTMDGPTKKIFPDGPIPYIWTGRIQRVKRMQLESNGTVRVLLQ